MEWQDHQLYEEKMRVLANQDRLGIIEKLKPTFSKDGNQFCFLLGSNLMEGIAGFGDTVSDAVDDFVKRFYTEKA